MRRPTKESHDRPPAIEPNMTPMIDVVFLLIIFFLVSSHLARRESRLELALPTASTGQSLAQAVPRRLTINIRADGQMLLGAMEIEPLELLERLATERNEHGERLQVRLRGDRDTLYAAVEPALAACAEAGIVDLGFGVFRGK